MSDTPRTIAEFSRITSQLDGAEDNLAYVLSQMSGLACTLERELAVAQAENKQLRKALEELLSLHDDPCPYDAASTRAAARAILQQEEKK